MERKLLAVLLFCAGCGDDASGVVVLDHADPKDFYSRPYPSDDRKNPDGTIDLSTYPRPSAIIKEYVDTIATDKHGFGENSAIYFRFSGPIDESTLPKTAADSLAASASVYLVKLDDQTRHPVKVHLRAKAGKYAGANLLAIEPFPGLPLLPMTKYAAVVTSRVRAKDGSPVGRDSGFQLPAGVPPDAAGATVFTTGDPTSDMKTLRDAVYRDLPNPPAPTMLGWQAGDSYDEYDGIYDAPFYQQGTVPFLTADKGGTIQFDAQGHPVLVEVDHLRFALTVPKGTMPEGGWPIVIYAHGTGGNYRSFISEMIASRLGAVGVAAISIDQVLHGPRDPTMSNPDITFFNFQNIAGARDNVRQGALDDFQLLRLCESWPATLALPMTGASAKFDPARIAFMGHSQGGLTGPLFVAYEPKVRGAVFSGAAALLVQALLNKTEPVNIPDIVATLLDDDPIDEFHPLLNLVQQYFEPAEPANFGRLYFQAPPAGIAPRSIFQTIGIVDHYAPVPGLKAFMLAIGNQPVGTMIDPIDGLDVAGVQPIASAPVTGNVAGGQATGVSVEYMAAGYDGHFVVFDNADAARQSTGFLRSLLEPGAGPATLPQ